LGTAYSGTQATGPQQLNLNWRIHSHGNEEKGSKEIRQEKEVVLV
jgi:hypothetical protein